MREGGHRKRYGTHFAKGTLPDTSEEDKVEKIDVAIEVDDLKLWGGRRAREKLKKNGCTRRT